MYYDHAKLIEDSIAQVRARRSLDDLAASMFKKFFHRHPEAEAFFTGFDLAEIGPFKFCKVGDAMIDVLKFPSYSESSLSEEVYRHQVHDVRDKEYYFALADAYVETIKETLGDDWTGQHTECWHDTLSGLRHNIDMAAKEHLGEGSCPVTATRDRDYSDVPG